MLNFKLRNYKVQHQKQPTPPTQYLPYKMYNNDCGELSETNILENMTYAKIPLNIYQTWHTKKLPYKMYNNVCLLKNINPEFKYFLFDDNDCREFIKNNFSEDVLMAFDKLKPGAYKADLWRYCILYKYGGIYLDIKFMCINEFKLIELAEKEHFVHDLNNKGIYNALIVSRPCNKILLNCINKIVKNVKNNYYGDNMLSPTGPMLIEEFFNKETKKCIELSLQQIMGKNKIFIKFNNRYILGIYEKYREEQKLYQNNEHYSILWNNKNIYYKCEIPLKIYQTWHSKDLPPVMSNYIDELKFLNPEFEHYIFDDEECRQFIQDNYNDRVLNAYNKLIPQAFRSDLWRYCVLYKTGGIYLDVKHRCLNNFKLISLTEEEHFVRDCDKVSISNSLICCKPNNQKMLNCINDIVYNVETEFYGYRDLCVTGPHLLGKNFKQAEINKLQIELNNLHFIKYNGIYILGMYEKYREEQKLYQNNEHYFILWNNKNIYYK